MALSWQDKIEIHELMARYAAAVDLDGVSEEEFLEIFTDDAVLTSPFTGRNTGLKGLRRFWNNTRDLKQRMMIRHYVTNVRVDEVHGEVVVRAYFIEMATMKVPRLPKLPKKTEFLFSGLYICKAVNSETGWRLSKREVLIDSHS